MKIFLELIDEPVKGTCVITGKKTSYTAGYGFFADGKRSKPVAEKTALDEGFTVTKQTLRQLAELIEDGKRYEEVQKSAHEEFQDLK